ncbi:hypothetical protein NE700_21485, partial [Phocaeicola vulgatus]|uniref:hypothetical protein n=1 Tax=Phocaeicola vulgatus TaxID=821 RepID=UPI00210EBFEF
GTSSIFSGSAAFAAEKPSETTSPVVQQSQATQAQASSLAVDPGIQSINGQMSTQSVPTYISKKAAEGKNDS